MGGYGIDHLLGLVVGETRAVELLLHPCSSFVAFLCAVCWRVLENSKMQSAECDGEVKLLIACLPYLSPQSEIGYGAVFVQFHEEKFTEL